MRSKLQQTIPPLEIVLAFVGLVPALLCMPESHFRVISGFWDGIRGQEYVTKLHGGNFSDFITGHNDSFVMFYTNGCRSSHLVKAEFANVALEMAYTEGFNMTAFGAIDCNTTDSSHNICGSYNIKKFPRFLYFKNGRVDRQYTVDCPQTREHLYHWIINSRNEHYCSTASFTVTSGNEIFASSLGLVAFFRYIAKQLFS